MKSAQQYTSPVTSKYKIESSEDLASHSSQTSNWSLLVVGSGNLGVLLTRETESTLCSVGTITAEELREHEEEEEEEECDDTGPDRLDIGGGFIEGAQKSVVGVASIFPLPVAIDCVVLSPIDELRQGDIPVVPEGVESLKTGSPVLEFETQEVPVGRGSSATKLDHESRSVIRDALKFGMPFDQLSHMHEGDEWLIG